ncbi:MAG: peptide deformylase [Lentisphaeria bacterium]|nr:peptide deformylase [Lentisphaeria bacterium]
MLKNVKKKTYSMKYLGEECLHRKVQDITEINQEVRDLSAVMLEMMRKHDGVGLAAPQIGVNLRLVVLDVPPPKDQNAVLSPGERELLGKMPLVLVNPRIESYSPVTDVCEEGCLSVPGGIYAPVERPVSVVLKTTLLDGPEVTLDCGGFLARALQHELDHLEGIVYVQKVKDPAFDEILPQLKKIIKKYGPKSYKIKRLV